MTTPGKQLFSTLADGKLTVEVVETEFPDPTGNQVLVETHSEHLVLRLLRRVREGVLNPEDLAILYVEQHADGAAFVRRLDVDSDGELAGGWPGDFFAERLDEVFGGLV